jgi:ATP-binding protein involved in chromosome partitioning
MADERFTQERKTLMRDSSSSSGAASFNSKDSIITEAKVLEWLRDVKYPGYSRDIVSFGLVDAIEIDQGMVKVFLQITTENKNIVSEIENKVKERLSRESSVRESHVSVHVKEPEPSHTANEIPKPVSLPGVDKVIAVASGKGGVGKSSVAAMLALKAAESGLKTGLLDLDIYGPSLPMMMGVSERPDVENNRIIPHNRFGLSLMSIGFFIEGETPLIWRGPMVAQAATQLLTEVAWDNLDLLVIDLPPGTGDAQLTLAQKVQLDGVVIVTTPQDLALLDARKGVMMFMRVGVHILGIVENMSVFHCPNCGYEAYLFGKGGGKTEAIRLRIPFLGEVPLDPKLREAVDTGRIDRILETDNPVNRAFDTIFKDISLRLGVHQAAPK